MDWNKYSAYYKLEPFEVEQAIREYVEARRPELVLGSVEYNQRAYDGYKVFVRNAREAGLTLSS